MQADYREARILGLCAQRLALVGRDVGNERREGKRGQL
jgi:hypothetical protein